jgi:nucleotide-binding universal stress UspA family protein
MAAITHVLCPVDFSEQSRHALEHARAFARFYDARLTALHVYSAAIPPMGSELGAAAPLTLPVDPEALREEVRRFGTPEPSTAGTDVSVVVQEGIAAKEIVRYADEHAVDLLVLGTHGRSGFEHLFLGSVAEKVVRSTQLPVMTVPPAVEHTGPVRYGTILCATDFSAASARALAYALELAKQAGSRVVMLHVVEVLTHLAAAPETAAVSLTESQHRLEEGAKAQLSEALPSEARAWCTPTEIVATGRAYREILSTASNMRVDLIAMGAHGHDAIDRWLFGSTTNHVIRRAHCPVLTLRG